MKKKHGENEASLHTSFNAQAMSYQNHQFWRTAFKHGLKQQHIILKDGQLVSAANSRKTISRFNYWESKLIYNQNFILHRV